MQTYKRQFIEFLIRTGALTFGDFETKSGRRTPYFINLGNVRRGPQILELARFYAAAICDQVPGGYDVLFGPAYKAIPLVCTTALILASEHGVDVPFSFDRKEAKDHGEGGRLVGHVPAEGERVLILEDVTTAGTSIRQAVALLSDTARIELAGLVVAIDRMERGLGEKSALCELAEEFSMFTCAIVTIDEVVEVLASREIDGRALLDGELLERIRRYRAQYGA
ncbi:MAG: orotate phosphoribosyltransferase [Planctomycetes bacterium]|jgi:orotate phosphoribosyltransferase|nr:orotate phosphoribosyltransferase [Planctomycetota bacterium]